MKIRVGKYTWNSKKCVPLQMSKYVLLGAGAYFFVIAMYYVLLPISTLG